MEKRILENIKKNPRVTYDELAARLETSRSSIKREIGKMNAGGLIERVGGKRYGHWKILE